MFRLARDRDGGFREARLHDEGRGHCLLADAAMTDAHADGRSLDAVTDRAAGAAALIRRRKIDRVGGNGTSVDSFVDGRG